MKPNRELQLQILEYLREYYVSGDAEIENQDFHTHPDYSFNMKYLYGLGLIDGQLTDDMGQPVHIVEPNITERGIDFLEDDGGLSALLSTVTIRFDADSIRTLIENKIINTSLPEPQRKTLIEKIKNLSSDALRQVALKLLEIGVVNPDKLRQLIETMLNVPSA